MALQVVKPRIRGFICTNAHSVGCHQNVQNQVNHIKEVATTKQNGPNVLVVGASTGYGLASRIALTWAYAAKSIGIFYERPASGKRTATAGYYNSAAFHQLAAQDGFFADSINGDAFSDEIKRETIDRIKGGMGKIDMVVYSIAAPRRIHPRTGAEHNSVLKPIGQSYTSRTIDLNREVVTDVTLEAANEQEITDTVAVMGGRGSGILGGCPVSRRPTRTGRNGGNIFLHRSPNSRGQSIATAQSAKRKKIWKPASTRWTKSSPTNSAGASTSPSTKLLSHRRPWRSLLSRFT